MCKIFSKGRTTLRIHCSVPILHNDTTYIYIYSIYTYIIYTYSIYINIHGSGVTRPHKPLFPNSVFLLKSFIIIYLFIYLFSINQLTTLHNTTTHPLNTPSCPSTRQRCTVPPYCKGKPRTTTTTPRSSNPSRTSYSSSE